MSSEKQAVREIPFWLRAVRGTIALAAGTGILIWGVSWIGTDVGVSMRLLIGFFAGGLITVIAGYARLFFVVTSLIFLIVHLGGITSWTVFGAFIDVAVGLTIGWALLVWLIDPFSPDDDL